MSCCLEKTVIRHYEDVFGPLGYDWASGGSVDFFFCMVSVVLLLWGVDAFLGNGYEIQGQDLLYYFREVKCQQGFTTGI